MRIRRKKKLDERVDSAENIVLIDKRKVNVLEANADKKYIDLFALFGNDNPIELEIGCGKGRFIAEKAERNPNINYLAVECIANIIIVASDLAKEKNLTNVKFLNTGAEYLPRYLKDESVENIYLNFSPPYPQSSYENRRLTNDRYLGVFNGLLRRGGKIYQKTDDKGFFDYSVAQFGKFGFIVKDVSDNPPVDEIRTEFEIKFIEQGVPIYRLIAEKPND